MTAKSGEEGAVEFETILLDKSEDGVAVITLNRPNVLNAFNPQMLRDLILAFDDIDADDEVRAVIVTGAGRAFCAGADLSAGGATFDYSRTAGWTGDTRAGDATDPADPALRDGGGLLALRLWKCRKPIIAAINGPAVGVGATMTLPMDVRIASDSARLHFVFAARGIVPEATSSWFLPRLVGVSRALEWCCAAEPVDAHEAQRAGLLRDICESGSLLDHARAIALRLTAGSSAVSVAAARRMLYAGLASNHPMEAHRLESRMMVLRGASDDAQEGVSSFLEKRPASFPDKVSKMWPRFANWFADPSY